MQLDEGRPAGGVPAGVAHPGRVERDGGHGLGEQDAVGVLRPGQVAGPGQAGHDPAPGAGLPEAGALLGGEHDEPQRMPVRDPVRGDEPGGLHRGGDPDDAVEPAAVRHAVQV